MDHYTSCTPISIGCDDSINYMAFDGCSYYCTTKCNCTIIKLDRCYNISEKFYTKREYDCICYDWCEHIFWASSKNCFGKLFKLDCKMNEIDCIHLCNIGCLGSITAISYNCCSNTLMLSFTCAIAEVNKNHKEIKVLYSNKRKWIMSILSLCPGIISVVLKDGKYYIEIYDECFNIIKCYEVPDKIIIKSLVFNPCSFSCKAPYIYGLVLKRSCRPSICSCKTSKESLGFEPCRCNYNICNDCTGCNPCDSTNACTDIMESIALVETALSHILNAEGEKIQKVLSMTDNIDKILCVNREVNKTIVNATHLEHILYAKLNTLSDLGMCCKPCDKPDNGSNICFQSEQ